MDNLLLLLKNLGKHMVNPKEHSGKPKKKGNEKRDMDLETPSTKKMEVTQNNGSGMEKEVPSAPKATDKQGQAKVKPSSVASSLTELKNQLAAAKEEEKKHQEALLYHKAEMDNFRKRMHQEVDRLKKFANEKMIKDFLTVFDNFEYAIDHIKKENSKEGKKLLEGIELTRNEFLKVLKNYGVIPVEAIGKPFDPAFHEAISHIESKDYEDNTIITVARRGFLIHGRLLRPAQVVISKKKS